MQLHAGLLVLRSIEFVLLQLQAGMEWKKGKGPAGPKSYGPENSSISGIPQKFQKQNWFSNVINQVTLPESRANNNAI